MDHFSQINEVYAAVFGTNPPTRACVAIALPPPVRIRLEAIAYASLDISARRALHVQGLSYWAPANIGPYSQAVDVRIGEQSTPRRTYSIVFSIIGRRCDICLRPNWHETLKSQYPITA